MLNVKTIRNEMKNTFLNRLPSELLLIILDMKYFLEHVGNQYEIIKQLREVYLNKLNIKYKMEYVELEDVGLIQEIIFFPTTENLLF